MHKEIKLPVSGYIAYLKESITYGEFQQIQSVLMKTTKGSIDPVTKEMRTDFDPAATIEWTYIKILTVVEKIEKENKIIPFNRQLIENLDVEDGELLASEVESILENIKKKQETKN